MGKKIDFDNIDIDKLKNYFYSVEKEHYKEVTSNLINKHIIRNYGSKPYNKKIKAIFALIVAMEHGWFNYKGNVVIINDMIAEILERKLIKLFESLDDDQLQLELELTL